MISLRYWRVGKLVSSASLPSNVRASVPYEHLALLPWYG